MIVVGCIEIPMTSISSFLLAVQEIPGEGRQLVDSKTKGYPMTNSVALKHLRYTLPYLKRKQQMFWNERRVSYYV